MRQFLKITALVIVGLLLLFTGACLYLDKPLPTGTKTPRADSMAHHMMRALNKSAWDTSRFVTWRLRNNHYLWDRDRSYVQLKMNREKILLNTNALDKSIAYEDDQRLTGNAAKELIDEAWEKFCNDSYWLVAPFKVFDPGTERKVVEREDNADQLLVTHKTGGVTPGDSYLWQINEQGMPLSFRMWVSVIPIGGLKATWDTWKTCQTGVMLPTHHRILLVGFGMDEVEAYATATSAGLSSDPFVALEDE